MKSLQHSFTAFVRTADGTRHLSVGGFPVKNYRYPAPRGKPIAGVGEKSEKMTIKRRLFISNIFMLIIPALVSVLMILAAGLIFMNAFYKQFMDETIYDNNLSQMQRILVEQSKEFLSGDKEIEDSQLYDTVNKYLKTKKIKMEIYEGGRLMYTLGSMTRQKNEEMLFLAMRELGGEGNITVGGSALYGEKISADGKENFVYIFTDRQIKEDEANEAAVKRIAVLLCLLIIAAVVITNRFLTKFIVRRIEEPLDILVCGVHQIRDGNLDYRIEYSGNDEFKSICDSFNEMAARLKDSVELSKRNDRSRRELIAGISHDLRTPLTSIKAYASGLIEGVAATPAMQKKYTQTILTKANDIDRMVDKLFLFSKLDLGDYPFYPEKIGLKKSVSHLLSSCEKDMTDRGMNIKVSDMSEDITVYADPVQFENALTNILENSLKYKDGERVNVNIGCEESEDSVKLIIDDDGPGVPQEAVSKLFDVFYRSDPSRNAPNKGSGLGLAITAKILERFGGKIWAENLSPKGLRIVMLIPKEPKEDKE